MQDRHKKVKHVTALQKYENDSNDDGIDDVGTDDGDEGKKDQDKEVKRVTALGEYENDDNYDGDDDVGTDDGVQVMMTMMKMLMAVVMIVR